MLSLILHSITTVASTKTLLASGPTYVGGEWNSIVANCVTSDGVATLACLPAVFKNIINAALAFSGTTALLFIMYAGYKYIRSEGDAKNVDAARKIATYAIIGLVIILSSFAILNFISLVTNVPCIKSIGFGQCNT